MLSRLNQIRGYAQLSMKAVDPERVEFMKRSTASFIGRIQDAQKVQELMELVIELEDALPEESLLKYRKQILPSISSNVNDLAVRIFSLDRAILYENLDLKGWVQGPVSGGLWARSDGSGDGE